MINPDDSNVPYILQCGVPQGSPLSPLLYVIYTSDLLRAPSAPDCELDAYADDLTVVGSGATFLEAEMSAQAEVNRIASWACLWRQRFNPSKSEVLAFSRQPVNVQLEIGGVVFPQVPVMRILGIHFDEKLTWKAHIDRTLNRCGRNLSWFRAVVHRPGLSFRWRRTAYLALVRSIATFGFVSFASAAKTQLRRLDVLQNNCLRAMLNVRLDDRVPIRVLEQRCRLPSLPSFLGVVQRRYAENAVRFVLPLREDIESVRLSASPPQKSPVFRLNSHLSPGPLPAMA